MFDRSKPLPTGGTLEQADGTAWMGFYCLTMLDIALELAQHYDRIYEVCTVVRVHAEHVGHCEQVLRALRADRRRHEQ